MNALTSVMGFKDSEISFDKKNLKRAENLLKKNELSATEEIFLNKIVASRFDNRSNSLTQKKVTKKQSTSELQVNTSEVKDIEDKIILFSEKLKKLLEEKKELFKQFQIVDEITGKVNPYGISDADLNNIQIQIVATKWTLVSLDQQLDQVKNKDFYEIKKKVKIKGIEMDLIRLKNLYKKLSDFKDEAIDLKDIKEEIVKNTQKIKILNN